MAHLVSAVLTDFASIFNNASSAKQLELFQSAHNRICRIVKLYPDDIVNVPLVSGGPTSDLNEHIERIWQAHYVTGASTYDPMEEASTDEKDYNEKGWRGQVSGVPSEFMDEGPTLRWNPVPNSSSATLAISGATNASPIVVTSAAHGLSSNDDGTPANAVTISGVLGNTAANGAWYAKVTGYSSTTFALYWDQALTVPVAGNGAYSSGGTLTTPESYPLVQLFCQKRRVLLTTDYLPAQIDDYDAWTDLMCFQWARRRHRDRMPEFAQLARASINALSWKVMGRAPRLKPSMHFDVPEVRH